MNWIKKILASPYIKSFVPSNNWTWAAFLIAVLLLALLIYLIIRRRKTETVKETVTEIKKEDFLSPASLLQIWKTFLKNIPAQFRRSIKMYQPFIVMGEAGTGKTGFIDNYTDWKNQSNQFYPSHTQDTLLQIYLGSRIVVQEIPATLLHDTSSQARKALVNLWKRIKRKKGLTVVITLKAETLLRGNPDSLKEQAQMIRGKINILSGILKRPVNVKISLTFMNHVNGFSKFSDFLEKNNVPFEMEINSQKDLKNLKNVIKPYEKYLSNALVSETSENYLKILTFSRIAPRLMSGLSRFIHILTTPAPLSSSPNIKGIFFTANSFYKDKPLSNPFKSHVSIKKVRSYHPLIKHQAAVAALAVACIGYLIFSYHYKQNQASQIQVNMEKISNTVIGTNQSIKEVHDLASTLLDDLGIESEKIIDDRFLIDFFPDTQEKMDARIIKVKKGLQEKIIQNVFIPELSQINEQDDIYRKNLLLLALIYASNTNELGKIIKDHINDWVTTCHIPQNVIEGYISLSDTSWDTVIPLSGLMGYNKHGNTHRYHSWLLFLKNVEKLQEKSYISPKTLSKLQKDALTLVEEVNVSEKTDLFDNVQGLLARETVLADYIILAQNVETTEKRNYIAFKKFLKFFWKLELDSTNIETIDLAQLFENINVMMVLQNNETEDFEFEINKKTFYYKSSEFHDLIKKSSIALLLRNYVSYHSQYPGSSFFQQDSVYEDLEVSISSENNFYFSKKSTINGRYTIDTYTTEVMPVLNELPAFLEKLPVNKADKNHFSNFMFLEVGAYIHNYINNYEKYYKGFRINAKSDSELRYILTQMTHPLSQFQEFLMVLNKNLSFEYGDNPYFDLIKSRVRPLRFFSHLLKEQENQFPEFEKYKAILRQILGDLESTETLAVNKEDELNTLKMMLSPEARLSLDIFRDGPESYLNIIKKWGTSVGISDEWLYPFLEPVHQLYLLGQDKFENIINKEWNSMEIAYINPVIDQFPFNPEAKTPITTEALKNLTLSTGAFQAKFSSVIAPLCMKGPDGNWKERSFAMSSLKYPDNMFTKVNYISKLSQVFFDEKGEPKPLVFDVKPHTLPKVEDKLMYVTLSYLRSGKNAVFGFNQQPSWQKFNLEWWNEDASSVGVEFVEKQKQKGKIFNNITVPNSYWSFYRMLEKADTHEDLTWMWDVESRGDIKMKRAISFSIKKDPWAVFKKTAFEDKNKKG